ncbi:hypothetical protein [Zoogloea sp.]|uniref:hypothetical protein n=1 Tax=Zoogloea sp. TaxID=49181 RepID=UPI002619225B|nr:hypothetical protein [Zoogloea sp.]
MFRLPKTMLARLLLPCLAALLTACSVTDRAPAVRLEPDARWVVLPFANVTETPFAGQRAEAVSEGLLRVLGVADVRRYPASLASDNLFDNGAPKDADKSLEWARSQGARYALTGTVDEWRYKVGVDGEPAVGVTLSIVEVSDGRVLWSAVGAKSGWSRDALSAVAQTLIKSLLTPAVRP